MMLIAVILLKKGRTVTTRFYNICCFVQQVQLLPPLTSESHKGSSINYIMQKWQFL